jgi:FkbM family methyltransferase
MSKVVIEIGANDGSSTIGLVEKYKLPTYAVEPVPRNLIELWNKFKDNKQVTIIPTAIDIEFGLRKFNIAGQGDWGCCSLYEFIPNIRSIWVNRDDFVMTDSIEVICITGKQLVEMIKATSIEYLWIDAQGNDFRVLQSFGDKLALVKSGRCEASWSLSLYKGSENHYTEVTKFLVAMGFQTRVNPDSAGKECDIHFERKA